MQSFTALVLPAGFRAGGPTLYINTPEQPRISELKHSHLRTQIPHQESASHVVVFRVSGKQDLAADCHGVHARGGFVSGRGPLSTRGCQGLTSTRTIRSAALWASASGFTEVLNAFSAFNGGSDGAAGHVKGGTPCLLNNNVTSMLRTL